MGEIGLKSGEIVKIGWNRVKTWFQDRFNDFSRKHKLLLLFPSGSSCLAAIGYCLLPIAHSFIFLSTADTHTHTHRTKSKSLNLISFSINNSRPHTHDFLFLFINNDNALLVTAHACQTPIHACQKSTYASHLPLPYHQRLTTSSLSTTTTLFSLQSLLFSLQQRLTLQPSSITIFFFPSSTASSTVYTISCSIYSVILFSCWESFGKRCDLFIVICWLVELNLINFLINYFAECRFGLLMI